jgi:hypothetical protein
MPHISSREPMEALRIFGPPLQRRRVTSGEQIMWGFASQWLLDPWGYGGYGPIHMIIWIILVIAFVAGITWRVVRAQRQSRR